MQIQASAVAIGDLVDLAGDKIAYGQTLADYSALESECVTVEEFDTSESIVLIMFDSGHMLEFKPDHRLTVYRRKESST